MKRLIRLIVAGTILLSVLITAAFGVQAQTAIPRSRNSFPVQAKSHYAWVSEKWSGDEIPYKQFRISVDNAVQQGQSPAKLAEKYSDGKQDRQHPLAVFRWAYPAYLAEKQKGFPERSQVMQDIRDYMQYATDFSPPHNYEYDHLRFLAITHNEPIMQLAIMGERLVQRNPEDYEVRYLWGECMSTSSEYARTKNSVDNARILVKTFPKDPIAQLLLAGIYGSFAGEKKYQDSKTLDQATVAYQEVLSLSKPGDKNYKAAQFYIDHMLTMKKWYAEHPGR